MSGSFDFILMPGNFPVLVFRPYGPVTQRLIERLQSNSEQEGTQLQLILGVELKTASALFAQVGPCVAVSHAQTEADLQTWIRLLTENQEKIKSAQLRLLLTNPFGKNPLKDTLRNLGVTELIDGPIHDKALAQKVFRAAKSLASNENLTSPQLLSKGGNVLAQPALSCTSDFWMSQPFTPNFSNGNWCVELKGPGPQIGNWMPAGESTWQWNCFEQVRSTWLPETGFWIFKGAAIPTQSQNSEIAWSFLGETHQPFSLTFVSEGKEDRIKFKTDSLNNLLLAADSFSAFKMQPQFSSTWGNQTEALPKSVSPIQPAQTDLPSGKVQWVDTQTTPSTPPLQISSEQHVVRLATPEKKLNSTSSTVTQKGVVKMVSPLSLESDFWSYEKGDVIRIQGRWSIKLTGPTQAIGRWQARPGHIGQWVWTPRFPNTDPFLKEQGEWIYTGDRPKVINAKWTFAGVAPKLQFIFEEQSYGNRIICPEPGVLEIAQNSLASQAALKLIEISKKMIFGRNQHQELATQKAFAEALKERVAGLSDLSNQSALQAELTSIEKKSAHGIDTSTTGPNETESTTKVATELKDPFSFAHTFSEHILMRKSGTKQLMEAYCAQMRELLSATRVELWKWTAGVLIFSGSNDGTNGLWRRYLVSLEHKKTDDLIIEKETHLSRVSIKVRGHDGELLGVLCLECSAECIEKIEPNFWQGYGEVATGLLISA